MDKTLLSIAGGVVFVLGVALSVKPILGYMHVAEVKKVVRSQLIDPSSAQFRNVAVMSRLTGESVCGEVNGKNRMGGYTGFKRFVTSVSNEGAVFIETSHEEAPEFELIWRLQCE